MLTVAASATRGADDNAFMFGDKIETIKHITNK